MQKLSNFNIIWAPWRIGYILKVPKEKCFICLERPEKKKSLVVFQTPLSKVILNAFPYNNGHLLIAPQRHISRIEKLSGKERQDIFDTLIFSIEIVKDILNPQGFNVGLNLGKVSGAGLSSHLHFHIVPRWKGDTNFMRVISSTKVIPQSLESLSKLLRDGYKRRAGKDRG